MPSRRPCAKAIATIAALALAACNQADGTASLPTAAPVDPPTSEAQQAAAPAPLPATDSSMTATGQADIDATISANPPGCDPLDTRHCVLPFPSDALTVPDETTSTGRRVAFPATGLPTNAGGVPIDPSSWNRHDGFSANTPILAWFEDLDPIASALPSWTDLGGSIRPDAPVAVVDTSTGERVPLWVDVDPAVEDGALLTVRPAISLRPATRYAVGFRNLITTAGAPIEPSALFSAYRDRLTTTNPAVEQRRTDMDTVLDQLDAAGIERSSLTLAWSFTTASVENTTKAILEMRGETLGGLDTFAPEFEIFSVVENPSPGIARFIDGTFTVPNWMTGEGEPGSTLNQTVDGAPELNGVAQSPFACTVPDAVVAGTEPAKIVMYGHGLLGSHLEVGAGDVVAMGNEHNAVHCATKWAGFADDDIPTAIAALQDFSVFPAFVDRQLQGLINQLVLGRLMLAANGLVSEPPFQRIDGAPLIDTEELFYDGNSQGGIMGMTLAAISTDVRRVVLGVVGINYSTLLTRSVDFDIFETVLDPAYPDPVDRAIVIAAAQMLWDATDGAGYVRHVVDDPLRGTPPKEVLLHVAFGDWQVSELTAMVAARTMGVPIHRPVTADGRSREIDPGWSIDTLDYADATSGLVVWDSGSDPIPVEAVPPGTSRDPHGDPRNDVEVRRQKAAFLFDGVLIDVCNAGPCAATPVPSMLIPTLE